MFTKPFRHPSSGLQPLSAWVCLGVEPPRILRRLRWAPENSSRTRVHAEGAPEAVVGFQLARATLNSHAP
eukprot:15458829-Alexandrium_andersonii.AAC.1